MRTDTIGPVMLRVLRDHKPIVDQVRVLIIESIKDSSAVRKEITDLVDMHGITRKGIWVERIMLLVVSALIAALVGAVVASVR